MRLKINFLIRSLGHGGAEQQMVVLARGLRQYGHDVSVMLFYSSGSPLEQELAENNIPVIHLQKKGRWDILPFMGRLVGALRRSPPDIIHSYLTDPNLFSVILKPFLPGSRVVWGVRSSNMELHIYDCPTRLAFLASRLTARFADLIILNSRAGRNYYGKHGYPEKNMLVIQNGIDTTRFRPDPATRKKVRAEWGIKDNEKLVGLVGRLDPIKDHPSFIKAASLLADERRDVRFACVGDGAQQYKSKLLALTRDLGLDTVFVWAGHHTEVEAVYNALDIAVSASSSEGCPNVVAEAMACGVPCVVTDAGDSALLVGDLGRVVPVGRPDLLSKGLKECLENLDKYPRGLIRERITKSFSVESLLRNTNDALLKL